MTEPGGQNDVRINKKDLISELPRHIIETILDFMPIRNAVRTSILSRNWRHQWTTIPHLVLDSEFLSCMYNLIWKFNLADSISQAYEFASVVNRLLLYHNGPLCKVFIIIPDFHFETIADFLEQWTFLLSRKGMKEFTIDNWSREELHTLHSQIFSCQELTNLTLRRVKFGFIPSFVEFASLTNLELESVSFAGTFNFGCPLLESLTLMYCFGVSHLNFRAPNLKRLIVRGDLIPFTSTETLKVLSFSLETWPPDLERTSKSNLVKVLCHLPRIERLYLGTYFLKYLAAGGAPSSLPKPLHYLKNIKISFLNLADPSEVSCLQYLIRSAPCLRNIEISAMRIPAAMGNFRIEDTGNCTLSQLQVVALSCLCGSRAELELIKYFLAHSPVLETIFIHFHEGVQIYIVFTMALKIMQFPKASSKAEIKHLKDHEVDRFLGKWDG